MAAKVSQTSDLPSNSSSCIQIPVLAYIYIYNIYIYMFGIHHNYVHNHLYIYIYIYLGSGIRTCEDEEFDSQSLMWETLLYIIYIYVCIHLHYISPLQFGGVAGTPDSVEGPKVRHQENLY